MEGRHGVMLSFLFLNSEHKERDWSSEHELHYSTAQCFTATGNTWIDASLPFCVAGVKYIFFFALCGAVAF
mgnify:CR=1 FL=1